MKAIWNGKVIAESEDTIEVDKAMYFPKESVKLEYLSPSTMTSVCSWKGTASYNDIVVDGKVNNNAAWEYKSIKSPSAKAIEGRIAFWNGVEIQ
ncbi:MAG: DUF427 domain-containing protein [Leptospiraceae bacterium]|nr:DUF427 domain-containing protein [Leptospiraceae bacterium]